MSLGEDLQAVIFDRDGTLIDTEGINIRAACEVFYRFFKITLTPTEEAFIVGRHPDAYLADFAKKYPILRCIGNQQKFKKQQARVYEKYFPKAEVFTSTMALLRRLRGKVLLVLNTSGDRRTTDMFLQTHGLWQLFDLVITREDCTDKKPHPESYIRSVGYLNAMYGTDLRPYECVAVEDSKVGADSARGAGIPCIVVPNEYTRGQDFSGNYLVCDGRIITDKDLFGCYTWAKKEHIK